MPLFNFSSPNNSAPPSINVLIDVGQAPIYTKTLNIVNALITPLSIINVWQDGSAPGRAPDEREMDALLLSAVPLNGSFDLTVSALPGPIVGQFRIRYTIT